jgi:hypothetical protein
VPEVPDGLSTGCFVLQDSVPGVGECARRVTHAGLNKDLGLVDPVTGEATAPATPRGRVGGNFARAVAGAIAETRRQWQDLQADLTVRYGDRKASLMVCAISHDRPVDDCRDPGPPTAAGVLVGVLGVGLGIGLVVLSVHRGAGRRRPPLRHRTG